MVGELRASHVIHLHRLMAAVRAEFEDDGMDDDRLADYREHEVVPTDFKATKVEHERALLTLSTTLSEWATEQTRTVTTTDETERHTGSRDGADPGPEAENPEREREREPEPAPEASASR